MCHFLLVDGRANQSIDGLEDLCEALADRWLSVTDFPVESNACVFAARVLRVVAERQKVPFRVMAGTTSIHTELPDVDNPPMLLDPASCGQGSSSGVICLWT
jgi:hypothetical protein